MKIFNNIYKTIGQIFFIVLLLSTLPANSLERFDKAESVSNYFSGILLLNDNKYEDSLQYMRKLNGLENKHINYSIKYLYSLINSGNIREAFYFSRKLEKQKLDIFESHLIAGVFYLKNSNLDLARKYFLKAKNKNSKFILNNYISDSLYNWSNLINLDQATMDLKKLDERFQNLKKIQNVFLNCYFDNQNTDNLFTKITSNQEIDFSRYNYFHASYKASNEMKDNAKKIVNTALTLHPRNLLLNQYKIDLEKNKNISVFNCSKEGDVVAEILYIASNALSSQSIYPLSNFYLNLAKYLNEDFLSYDTLLAENYFKIGNLNKAKKIRLLFNSQALLSYDRSDDKIDITPEVIELLNKEQKK